MADPALDVCTVNAGNTHTKCVAWRKNARAESFAWKTPQKPPSQVLELFKSMSGVAPIVLAGVVPDYKKTLVQLLRAARCETLVFRETLPAKIKIMPKPAEKVGDDRIAAALGALSIGVKHPWVVVDAGTALTINAVTPGLPGEPAQFEGGLIVPGKAIGYFAMAEFTSQLPSMADAPLAGPAGSYIGRSTKEAMRLGVHHAHVASAIELAKGAMRELGSRCKVILTGGGAEEADFQHRFIHAFPRGRCVYYPDLVHLGLFAAWKTQQNTETV